VGESKGWEEEKRGQKSGRVRHHGGGGENLKERGKKSKRGVGEGGTGRKLPNLKGRVEKKKLGEEEKDPTGDPKKKGGEKGTISKKRRRPGCSRKEERAKGKRG